jgi:DNA (cytosine-5)-methyltransferase 1
MEGQRSSLVLEAIRLIIECRPSVFVWENVKGTFSSNDGADFWAIVQAFTDIGGYRLEWQLLNTSWFLPQNRERIYLVGYSTTTGGDWGGVFPIAENNKSNTEQHGVEIVGHRGTGGQQGFIYGEAGIAPTLSACCYKDPTKVQVKQTLETSCNQAVVQPNYTYEKVNETIRRNDFREGEVKAMDLYNKTLRDESPTLTQPEHNGISLFDGYRIRRLTPIECERLQGFPDQHTAYGNYDGEVKPMSNSQRYKQCGNAVTVDVVAAVAKKCLPLFN